MTEFLHCESSRRALMPADETRLTRPRHPSVTRASSRSRATAARAEPGELLDGIEGPPLLLVLDGVHATRTIWAPACAWPTAVGAHAVIAPK